MAPPLFQFRPVEVADLPLLRRWLEQPHVTQWWPNPAAALAEIRDAMREPATEPFIVLCDGRPIGYQQSYDPHAEPSHPYTDQPRGTRGIDQFIGEPDMVGRGYGSGFIRAFAARLFAAGAPRVVTDPDPANARALRVYEKAGFRTLERRPTPWGDVMLMACDPAGESGVAPPQSGA